MLGHPTKAEALAEARQFLEARGYNDQEFYLRDFADSMLSKVGGLWLFPGRGRAALENSSFSYRRPKRRGVPRSVQHSS